MGILSQVITYASLFTISKAFLQKSRDLQPFFLTTWGFVFLRGKELELIHPNEISYCSIMSVLGNLHRLAFLDDGIFGRRLRCYQWSRVFSLLFFILIFSSRSNIISIWSAFDYLFYILLSIILPWNTTSSS